MKKLFFLEPQGRVPVPRPAKQRNNLSASPLVSGTVRLFYMSNFQKNSKDYGEPDITYQMAGSDKLGIEGNTLPDVFFIENK